MDQVLMWDGDRWVPAYIEFDIEVDGGDIEGGSITNFHISASAAIDQSKIAGLEDDLSGKLNVSGGTMSGAIDLDGNNLNNVGLINNESIALLRSDIDAKQDTITFPGDTTFFLDGDENWRALTTDDVAEGSAEYFSEGKVLDTLLAGYSMGPDESLAAGDNLLEALGKLEGQIDALSLGSGSGDGDFLSDGSVAMSGDFDAGTNDLLNIKDAYIEERVRLKREGSTSYISIQAPSGSGSMTFTLPEGGGAPGQVLQTDGFGVLTWATVSTEDDGEGDGESADVFAGYGLDGEMVGDVYRIDVSVDDVTLEIDDGPNQLRVKEVAQSQVTGLETALTERLELSGGTMSGDLNMGLQNITNVGLVDGEDISQLRTDLDSIVGVDYSNEADEFLDGTGVWRVPTTDDITEGSAQYFSEGRVLDTLLAGYSIGLDEPLAAGDSIIEALAKLEGQIDAIDGGGSGDFLADGTVPMEGDLDVGGFDITNANDSYLTGGLFLESPGTANFIELRAPAGSDGVTLVFPDTAGTTGQVLQTDGTGVLSWATADGVDGSLDVAAGDGLSGADSGGTYVIDANVDASTIIINGSDQLQVNQIAQNQVVGLEDALTDRLELSGGTMSGDLDMGNQNITNVNLVDGESISQMRTDLDAIVGIDYTDATATDFLDGTGAWRSPTTNDVTEADALYFTPERVLDTLLTDYVIGANSSLEPEDTIIEALGKLEGQIDALDGGGGGSGTGDFLADGSVPMEGNFNAGGNDLININDALLEGSIFLQRPGTSNYVELRAPAGGDTTVLVFPDDDGESGQILRTDGFGTLSWVDAGGGGGGGGDVDAGDGLSGEESGGIYTISADVDNSTITISGTGQLEVGTIDQIKVSGLQTALNNRLELDGGTMTGDLDLGGQSILSVNQINGESIGDMRLDIDAKQEDLNFPADASQFLNGTGAWQTLTTDNVTEGSAEYFTEGRVLSTLLDGYAIGLDDPLAPTDTVLEALGKLEGQIAGIDTGGGGGSGDFLADGSVPMTGDFDADGFDLTNVGSVFLESGSHTVEIMGPVAPSGPLTFRLPETPGLPDQVLKTDGFGNLSWAEVATEDGEGDPINDVFAGYGLEGTLIGDTYRIDINVDNDTLEHTGGDGSEIRVKELNADKVTSGVFDEARIPGLDASKIETGEINSARIPQLDASIIGSGTLNMGRIPDLDASIITSGTLDAGRVPALDASVITTGVIDEERLPPPPSSGETLVMSADFVIESEDNKSTFLADTGTSHATLPNTGSVSSNFSVTLTKISAHGHLEIEGAIGQSINGKSSIVLMEQYSSVTLVSNGSDWFIVHQIGDFSNCPVGYTSVKGNTFLGVPDFCVMTYEARDGGGNTPVSVPDGTPWTEINASDAKAACRSLGSGYDLISNREWMTIGRDIESISSNWVWDPSENEAIIHMGWSIEANSGPAPNSYTSCLYNSSADTCGATAPTSTTPTRRTHKLSSGGTIWDFSGNVFHWVDGGTAETYTTGPTSCDIPMAELSSGPSCPPLGVKDYAPANMELVSDNGVGIFSAVDDHDGGLIRGGSFEQGPGIFTFALALPTAAEVDFVGFRCVYRQ